MVKKIELPNGRVWLTQKAALKYFQDMLHRYDDEETVENRDDHEDLVALLQRYDECITDGPSKIGVGVDCFFRRLNVGEAYATPSFWVRRSNGIETEFSYLDGVRGLPKGRAKEFYDSCRVAAAAELQKVKKKQGAGNDADKDSGSGHPTFIQVVNSFRASRGWAGDIPEGIVTLPQDAQTQTTFLDASVAEAFRVFYREAIASDGSRY